MYSSMDKKMDLFKDMEISKYDNQTLTTELTDLLIDNMVNKVIKNRYKNVFVYIKKMGNLKFRVENHNYLLDDYELVYEFEGENFFEYFVQNEVINTELIEMYCEAMAFETIDLGRF